MSNLNPFEYGGRFVDLSARVKQSAAVVASPAANAETIIASLTITEPLQQATGVYLFGFAAYTVGTNGVSVNLKLRQTDTSGTTIKATGATTAVAANLGSGFLFGLDTAGTLPGQVYVLTMTVASGSASSAVSAVTLAALVV